MRRVALDFYGFYVGSSSFLIFIIHVLIKRHSVQGVAGIDLYRTKLGLLFFFTILTQLSLFLVVYIVHNSIFFPERNNPQMRKMSFGFIAFIYCLITVVIGYLIFTNFNSFMAMKSREENYHTLSQEARNQMHELLAFFDCDRSDCQSDLRQLISAAAACILGIWPFLIFFRYTVLELNKLRRRAQCIRRKRAIPRNPVFDDIAARISKLRKVKYQRRSTLSVKK
ncbi:hypothetical protein ACOME3_004830 [Neoechinorhynchus agilis]